MGKKVKSMNGKVNGKENIIKMGKTIESRAVAIKEIIEMEKKKIKGTIIFEMGKDYKEEAIREDLMLILQGFHQLELMEIV